MLASSSATNVFDARAPLKLYTMTGVSGMVHDATGEYGEYGADSR